MTNKQAASEIIVKCWFNYCNVKLVILGKEKKKKGKKTLQIVSFPWEKCETETKKTLQVGLTMRRQRLLTGCRVKIMLRSKREKL